MLPINSSLGEVLKVQMASQSLKIWTHLSLKWGPDSIFQRFPRLSDYGDPSNKTRTLTNIYKM